MTDETADVLIIREDIQTIEEWLAKRSYLWYTKEMHENKESVLRLDETDPERRQRDNDEKPTLWDKD